MLRVILETTIIRVQYIIYKDLADVRVLLEDIKPDETRSLFDPTNAVGAFDKSQKTKYMFPTRRTKIEEDLKDLDVDDPSKKSFTFYILF